MEDALFGEVLDALEATGQADDTLVLFMSDHGDYCGAHGLYLKGIPAFREAYHVPCIARWPSGIQKPWPTWSGSCPGPILHHLSDVAGGVSDQRHTVAA